MINLFKTRNKKETDSQRIFMEKTLEVFNPLFSVHRFQLIKSEYDQKGSKIIFKNEKKHIVILSQNDFRDGSFFEISIGEKFDDEISFFEGYYISITRLAGILDYKIDEFYEFPFGEKKTLNSLNKAKMDFLKCATFYLEEDVDLFDKVLKLKGIRN